MQGCDRCRLPAFPRTCYYPVEQHRRDPPARFGYRVKLLPAHIANRAVRRLRQRCCRSDPGSLGPAGRDRRPLARKLILAMAEGRWKRRLTRFCGISSPASYSQPVRAERHLPDGARLSGGPCFTTSAGPSQRSPSSLNPQNIIHQHHHYFGPSRIHEGQRPAGMIQAGLRQET